MDRRAFLAALGGSSTSLAGCLSGDGRRREQARTDFSPEPNETTHDPCANGGERVDRQVLEDGTLSGFDLTVSPTTVPRGEWFTARLENVSDDDQLSGVKSIYTVHRQTPAGWRDIFYRAPGSEQIPAYHAPALRHSPGEGYTWSVRFDEPGLAHDIEHGTGSLAVCPPLDPGTYRFVYFGVVEQDTADEPSGDFALGAPFSVVEG